MFSYCISYGFISYLNQILDFLDQSMNQLVVVWINRGFHPLSTNTTLSTIWISNLQLIPYLLPSSLKILCWSWCNSRNGHIFLLDSWKSPFNVSFLTRSLLIWLTFHQSEPYFTHGFERQWHYYLDFILSICHFRARSFIEFICEKLFLINAIVLILFGLGFLGVYSVK